MPNLPQRLHPGDLIGLICPASAPPDPKTVDASVAALEEMRFKVRLGRHARKRWGFLAGQDRERAADVMQMFGDRKVKGIVCLRGGYGTPRILPLLDYNVIRQNSKVFIGFSDITALHCAFLKKANLLSFHGPMTGSHLVQSDTPELTRRSWMKMLTEPVAFGSICKGYKARTISIINRGKASGELIGGNLTLLVGLVGTPFQPSFRNKVLFIEDVDEKPYRIDRNLTHLLNACLLQQVAGIAVGINENCHDPKAKKGGEYRQTLEDVFKERLGPLKVPTVIGLPFGHVPHNVTLPVGGQVMLDGDKGDLIISSPAVKT
jgi:muramoyltetrapeptide carboxypeptidase